MATELSYLTKLIDLINRDDDIHSKKRLWSFIGVLANKEVGALSDKEINRVLNEVHELNLEQIIKIQAYSFYNEFPINIIKQQLVNDFIEMEHCRRRDDFYRFCVAAYQQVENITNYIFKSRDLWNKTSETLRLEIPIYLNQEKQKWQFTLLSNLLYLKNSTIPVENEVSNYITNTNVNFLKFMDKFKCVLYFNYFKDQRIHMQNWDSIYKMGYSLHLTRNRVHRGSIDLESQKFWLENIEYNKYNYYLLFSGFLADFVSKISLSLKK